jgi:hypothetical protein
MIMCDGVTDADAWSGTALRALVEYTATRLLMPVTFVPPNDPSVWALLASLIGGLPNRAVLPVGGTWPDPVASVILPAGRVTDLGTAESLAGVLPTFGAAYPRREINFLAGALGELLNNALRHGAKSPIDVIATVAHERENNELQLVVADLSEAVSFHGDAERILSENWAASQSRPNRSGGLASIASKADRLDLDVSLAFCSGTGRFFWRGGNVVTASEQYIPGFTAAVTVHR